MILSLNLRSTIHARCESKDFVSFKKKLANFATKSLDLGRELSPEVDSFKVK